MLKKLSVLVLLACSTGTIAYAQKAPDEPKKPKKAEAPRVWSFEFDGGSYLGVEPVDVTRENFARFGLGEVRGVAVEKVVENSPAAAAGLQAGDVIVKFDGEEVSSVRKLTRLISEVAPDHKATLTVLRGGREQELTATLGKREIPALLTGGWSVERWPQMPEPAQIPNLPDIEVLTDDPNGLAITRGGADNLMFFGSNRRLGVSVTALGRQLGEYFGAPDGKGLLVNEVRADSPAAKAGLKAGDVILEVDGKPVDSNGDLLRALGAQAEGAVTLTILRDRARQTVQVTPEKIKSGLTTMPGDRRPAMNFQMAVPAPRGVPQTFRRIL